MPKHSRRNRPNLRLPGRPARNLDRNLVALQYLCGPLLAVVDGHLRQQHGAPPWPRDSFTLSYNQARLVLGFPPVPVVGPASTPGKSGGG